MDRQEMQVEETGMPSACRLVRERSSGEVLFLVSDRIVPDEEEAELAPVEAGRGLAGAGTGRPAVELSPFLCEMFGFFVRNTNATPRQADLFMVKAISERKMSRAAGQSSDVVQHRHAVDPMLLIDGGFGGEANLRGSAA